MNRPNVVSREYKLMLRPGRFPADDKDLLKAADAIWRDVAKAVKPYVLETSGGLKTISKRRLITFHDTPKAQLNRAGYIFRERRDAEAGKREVTLKFRHPDPYVAQNRDMESRERERQRTKFEEDIKAPFQSAYSFSTTVEAEKKQTFGKLKDVAEWFPDIVKRIDDFPEDLKLVAVKGFTARELVITGGAMQIGKTPRVDAECALVVWFDDERGRKRGPVAVEFSFRYGDPGGDYGGTMTGRAYDVFHALQRLGKWIDPKPRTKTAFVYG
jgi:hypothetical protein